MNTKVKQLILVTLLLLFLFLIFFFFTKNSFTNITGGVIANANTINANQIIFRLNSPTVTTSSSSTSLQPTLPSTPPPASGPGPSSVNTPPTTPTITPPTPTSSSTGAPPYFADTWNSAYPLAVYYSGTPVNTNPHACTSNNLVGYVDGTNFYPEGTTANVANADQVCYDNFDCQKCQFTIPGACDALTQQGYTCMFSFQPTNGGTVASCNFYQFNYMCKNIPPAAPPPSCNRIVLANSVGTDSILFRIGFPPSPTTSPAPPNSWNSGFSVAVTNDQPVGDNPHACLANNANRIGHVDGNFFYSRNSTSLPVTVVPTPVCYSNFICQPCTHANGGCNVYYAEGYVPYFSISSLASSKIQDCGISTYNYVCKESCFTTGMECGGSIQDPEGNRLTFTECIDDGTNACCSSNNQCVYGRTCYNDGDPATISNIDMTCTNEHWCPEGFYYSTSFLGCIPSQQACYDTTDIEYCNYVYPGAVPSNEYWTDLTGQYPCLRPDPQAVVFSEACCSITISLIDYFFYQDIPYTLNTDPTYLQSVNICGDTYDVGDVDGFCPSDFADCTPGYINDGDCCNHCGWVCDNANTLCGDNPGETWINEQDSNGNTITNTAVETCNGTCNENVIDTQNQGACTTEVNTCADDYVVYQDYSGSGACTAGTNCYDVDSANADMEICDEGNWHDPDENSIYCAAAGILGQTTWIITDQGEYDDYDNNRLNGYCLGDDGFQVQGYTYDENGDPLEDVHVQFKETLVTNVILQEDFTDNDGHYSVNILGGQYNIITEETGYIPQTQAVTIASSASYDFTMQPSTDCLQDCTRNDDVCYADCNNVNNCQFPTTTNLAGQTVMDICNNMHKDWIRPFDTNTEVVCCDNEPRPTTPSISVNPSSIGNENIGDIYSTFRLMWVRGERVILRITVWEEE